MSDGNEVYYRLYQTSEIVTRVVCMQWFDEYDYNLGFFINNVKYESESNAFAVLDSKCICGHVLFEHYLYYLNGDIQMRCRMCDPMRYISGNVSLEEGTYAHAIYFAADHKFQGREE